MIFRSSIFVLRQFSCFYQAPIWITTNIFELVFCEHISEEMFNSFTIGGSTAKVNDLSNSVAYNLNR